MDCTVVIRSLNEADRLRLVLTSLARQSAPCEVAVVNDGSSDHTAEVIDAFRDRLRLIALHHDAPHGRSAASNAGAQAASGDVLLFLDGDTLAHPDLVKRHLEAHAARPRLLGRGETYHMRCTRFLLDPETATPRPGEERRIESMRPAERERLKVTRRQIEEDFDAIERRASPGIYPGAGPRALYELEIDALRNHPDCTALWAASSGANFSTRRSAFLASGGFDEALEHNEHRELGLRMSLEGEKMGFVEGARTYHLTHRVGWRDPLLQSEWEPIFYRRHPILAVKLQAVLWASLADACPVPPEARIFSLPELEARARGDSGIDYDEVRRAIPGLGLLTPTA